MNAARLPLAAIALLLAAALLAPAGAAPKLKTKIGIDAQAANDTLRDAPCFILFPQGEARAQLEASGAAAIIEKRIRQLGYPLVENEQDAAVFVKVDFALLEPFPAEVEIEGRPRIDYSKSPSTRNHAAMMKGGRYQTLANPQRHQDTNNPESILGPSGEIIELSEHGPAQAKIVEGESLEAELMLYPIALEVSAWKFDESSPDAAPQQLWNTVAFYNNLQDEAVAPQLTDLAEAARRFFAKSLSETRFVKRR